MSEAKTSRLRKSAAVWGGVLLAFSLALALVPVKAWASMPGGKLPIDFTITVTNAPKAGAEYETPSGSVSLDTEYFVGTVTGIEIDDNDGNGMAPGDAYQAGTYEMFVTVSIARDDGTVFGSRWFDMLTGTINGEPAELIGGQIDGVQMADDNKSALLVFARTYTLSEPTPADVPTWLSDNAQSWTKGSAEGLTYRTSAPILTFRSVEVDGVELKKDESFALTEGSTIVTLLPAYLETLAVGDHSIVIKAADGDLSGTFTINAAGAEETSSEESKAKSPKTGVDATGIAVASALFTLCAACAAAYLVRSRRENAK